ncbi:MAG TPA: CHAT domain-containing tetratricopeptide repeat protein [Thermoanaerobaculia bacterium]|nr:CHAT domain-containing tetratricopeptide repeat protein [Thermoanaerobaculia bacterium]
MHDLLGEVDLRGGDAAAARRQYERALAIREQALGPTHPTVADSLEHLAAILARDETTTGAALDAALRAEAVTREHLRDTARGLAERRVLAYALARTSGLDWALTLIAAGRPEALRRRREIFDAVVRSRCLVLDEMAARQQSLLASDDPEAARLLGELESTRARWAWLSLRDVPSPEEREALDSARRQKEQTEQALAQVSSSFRREWERSRLGLDEVQRALPEDSSLISFVRYERQPLATGGRAVPAYLAFVLGAGGDVTAVPLATAQEIESLVDRWRALIQKEAESGGHGRRRSLREYREVAAELRRRVWDPVAVHLHRAQRVFLTADGALHRVSWAALPTGDDRFLVETDPQLHLLSTERDLVTPPDAPGGRGLLVMGAPDFDGLPPAPPAGEAVATRGAPALEDGAGCARWGSLVFRPLPGADLEVRAVGDAWRRRGDSGEVVSLRGAAASEAAFKRYAPGRAGLHLATHGVFLRACADDEATTGSGRAASALLRSALVLAGANRREGATGADDGVLTAEEVAGLNLRGVGWVVLSACESGIGDVEQNEGVFGLRRAFQVAGAQTVIASLWPLADASTRSFMQRLYAERLEHGATTMEAVRRATLSALAAARAAGRDHPFHWAGIVAVGGWR